MLSSMTIKPSFRNCALSSNQDVGPNHDVQFASARRLTFLFSDALIPRRSTPDAYFNGARIVGADARAAPASRASRPARRGRRCCSTRATAADRGPRHAAPADVAARDVTLVAQLRKDGARLVDGNREPDVGGARADGRVDADHFAARVISGPPAVAEVDRRVGLDVAVQRACRTTCARCS